MSRRGQIVRRAGQEHRGELVKLIKQAAYSTSTWQVWDDLIYMSAAAIAQPLQWVQSCEDEYLRRINKYDKGKQDLFPQMFAEIVAALEQEGCADVLGGIYMDLELGNHWKGQFFTPDHVCKLMAQITYNKDELTAAIERQGYITVNDCCCGGGAMLIAFADTCIKHEIDFQRNVLFVGQDVDPVVALMCYIQMSLLGMPGYVIIGNTLTCDFSNYDYWFTPMYFIHGFNWRRQREDTTDDEPVSIAPQDDLALADTETPVAEETAPQAAVAFLPAAEEYQENKVGQLTLF